MLDLGTRRAKSLKAKDDVDDVLLFQASKQGPEKKFKTSPLLDCRV